MDWKLTSLFLLAGLVLSGCATSTIQSRKLERPAAYAALPAEFKQAVDKGEILIGMSMDVVYIAWGKPSQVLHGESAAGPTTTWIYYGTEMAEYRYWAYRRSSVGPYYYGSPTPAYDWYPRRYLQAEVMFQFGVVTSWRVPEPAKR